MKNNNVFEDYHYFNAEMGCAHRVLWPALENIIKKKYL